MLERLVKISHRIIWVSNKTASYAFFLHYLLIINEAGASTDEQRTRRRQTFMSMECCGIPCVRRMIPTVGLVQ